MTHIIKLIFTLAFVLLLLSCSEEKVTNPTQKSYGSAQFLFYKESIPNDIYSITVELSRDGYTSIEKTVLINDEYQNLIFLNTIPIGLWNIKVIAKNEEGTAKYSGEAAVEIKENETMLVTITMEPITAERGSGSLIITVNWGSEGLPDNWENYDNNPIVKKYGSTFDSRGVSVPFVLKEESGFKMWYASFPVETGGKMYISFAKSLDGVNWEKHSYLPVLFPGEPGAWDDGHVGEPAVIKIGNKYVMYYGGFKAGSSEVWNIGRAESFDGITWVKDEEPILSGRWDDWDGIISPQSVLKINNIYYLYYSGRNYNESSYKIGIAVSSDGKNWERFSNQPILKPDQVWEGLGVYYPEVHLLGDGSFEMYYMNAFSNEASFGRAYSNDGLNWQKDAANPYIRTSNFLDMQIEKIAYPRFIKSQNADLLFYTIFDIHSNISINLLVRSNK